VTDGPARAPHYEQIPDEVALEPPIPGDIPYLEEVAERWTTEAQALAELVGPFERVCDVPWDGAAATAFEESVRRCVSHIDVAADTMHSVGRAVSVLATEVSEAQALLRGANDGLVNIRTHRLPFARNLAAESGDPTGWPATPEGRYALSRLAQEEQGYRDVAYRAREYAADAAQEARGSFLAASELADLMFEHRGLFALVLYRGGMLPPDSTTDSWILDSSADSAEADRILQSAAELQDVDQLPPPDTRLGIPFPVWGRRGDPSTSARHRRPRRRGRGTGRGTAAHLRPRRHREGAGRARPAGRPAGLRMK
jgi:hypothetical protein